MNKKVIFLNGPKGAGKDTAAKLIKEADLPPSTNLKFASPIKKATHVAYELRNPFEENKYETNKDVPNENFLGLTPREAYIDFSEGYFKVLHGEDVFGRMLARKIDKKVYELITVSDCGFLHEIQPVIDLVGKENCFLFRIHRPGSSFSEDSREYIYPNCIQSCDVCNDISLEEFQNKLAISLTNFDFL
jgi:hypothetical protein